jgi:hypothetical protein
MSGEVLQFAPRFPATQFAVIDMPQMQGTLPGNVIPVRCSRAQAYYEAGKICGAAFAGGRLAELGSQMCVIASGMTSVEKDLLSEFEKGFAAEYDTGIIITEELGTVSDRAKAVLTVEKLLNQEVKLFLVHTYGLNGACLEKIISGKAYFIIEDFASFNLFSDKCLLSIENDYTRALAAILQDNNFHPRHIPAGIARVSKGALFQDQE